MDYVSRIETLVARLVEAPASSRPLYVRIATAGTYEVRVREASS